MNILKRPIRFLSVSLILVATAVQGDSKFDNVAINTIPVNDGIYMLMGAGGNIGVSIGDDGTFIIDNQYAEMSGKITAAIKKLSGTPAKFMANTHWHGDHTGSNEHFGKQGVVIVAHENVRRSLSESKFLPLANKHKHASPKGALPVLTFQNEMSLHLNGDDIRLVHVANAHTDGDAIIHFTKANVIHAGDTFFNGLYPYIDVASNGSLAGMIAASNTILQLADEETKIIPGHGPLANKSDLIVYRDMLTTVEQKIGTLIRAGKNETEVIAAKPTAEFDRQWGKGFLPADVWIKIIYNDMTK